MARPKEKGFFHGHWQHFFGQFIFGQRIRWAWAMLLYQGDRSLTVWAPAKLNLCLEVLDQRADGFHGLETLMITVGLYDTLRFRDTPSAGVVFRCHQADQAGSPNGRQDAHEAPGGKDNLVVRAAELLRSRKGVERGIQIDLWKRIPVAAGMAGGSSDAAATLAGLNRFWKLGLSQLELHAFACELGSDVPFFLLSPAAICRGRGELISPVRFPLRLNFVVVRPHSGLSTADVFRNCSPRPHRGAAERISASLKSGNLALAAGSLFNGLQAPAESLNQDVVTVKQIFSRHPFLGHAMTGSGTAYFGLCAHRKHSLELAARLDATRIGHVFAVESRP